MAKLITVYHQVALHRAGTSAEGDHSVLNVLLSNSMTALTKKSTHSRNYQTELDINI